MDLLYTAKILMTSKITNYFSFFLVVFISLMVIKTLLIVTSKMRKLLWQSYLWATLPSWISCTNIPSSPLFSLLSPTTLNPRPPHGGLRSSNISTWRPCSGNKTGNKIKSQLQAGSKSTFFKPELLRLRLEDRELYTSLVYTGNAIQHSNPDYIAKSKSN